MENFRGAGLIVLAMAAFAGSDTFIKLMSGALPTWQITVSLGAGGALTFALLALVQGKPVISRSFLTRPIILRSVGEVVGTLGFFLALAVAPISLVSAILQVMPLTITLAAAVFLNEPVGWRRWSAICVGFIGTLIVIRPGMQGFDASSLIAVVAVLGLTLRDLSTRWVPAETSSTQLSYLAFLSLVPAGLAMALLSDRGWVAPGMTHGTMVLGSLVLAVGGYYAVTAAMRVGEVSFVTPFRYSRMVFALIAGIVVFGERPGLPMLLGTALIIGSGIYTVWRESKLKAAA